MKKETKVAASEVASQNSEETVKPQPKKDLGGKEKKPQGKKVSSAKNPFSFTDPLQQKFVNCLMKKGKKILAQKVLREVFDEIAVRGKEDALKVFETALRNATPMMEVKAKRIGGAVYQIPIEVKPKRQQSLSIRWILEGARKRKGQAMVKRLTSEILDSFGETGYAFNKKEDAHKMAQANKAFAHLARY